MRFRHRWLARVALPAIACAALLGGGSHWASAQTVPGPHVKTVHETVTIPASKLKSLLGNIKIWRVGHPGTAVALDDSPTCPDGWNSYNLTVNWTYDTDTGITLSSQAIWNDALTCDNMSYMESATSFFFNQNRTADGNTATCGSQGSPDNNCGYSGVVSTGNWSCDAGADCAGDYEMSGGVWVELPAGWQWTGSPPDGCWDDSSLTTMICSFNTNPITVPVIN
jgi:hypothetical protein